MKRNNLLLYFQILLLALLGILALIRDYHWSEISSASQVIRYTGEAIIDTQALVTLELYRADEDRIEAERLRSKVTGLLNNLSVGNPAGNLKLLNDLNYREELSRLYMQWKKLNSLIDVSRQSPENSIHLFLLSGEYYQQAKVTLGAVERYSSRLLRIVFLERLIGGVLWGMISLIPLYWLYENRRRTRRMNTPSGERSKEDGTGR